jgi:hypothetical protein
MRDNIIPQIREYPAFQTMIWLQDGAPLHYGQIVCDFSLCGIMKDCVHSRNPRDVNHLKSLIEEEFTSLKDNIEFCQTICLSVDNRCQMCLNTEGKQFEQLR